jgi:hopanoid biosynthesis associated protein HpnK
MRYLVINADDFGISQSVNEAIIQAHQKGCLTSTSLMITAEAAGEAIKLAKANPSLNVGLHLVLGGGKSYLQHSEIPHLVDKGQNFSSWTTWASLNYQFNPKVKAELEAEIRAQLEAFAQSGLIMTHLDSHYHHHINPTVMGIILKLAQEFSIPTIRLPYEEIDINLQVEPSGRLQKTIGGKIFSMLRHSQQKHLQALGIPYLDRVYGLLQTGKITEQYLLSLLPLMQGNLVELYLHPDLLGRGSFELEALVSEKVKEAIVKAGFQLVGFNEVINQV